MSFLDEANEIVPKLLEFRHYIHEHAETGFELPLTTAAITSRLDAMQIPWENVGGGIVATVGSGNKNILVRSEMDALPMPEENDLSFRSRGNKAHMCGHDLNATLLLGTLTLLKKHEKELKGQMVALFQPNEEGTDSPSGAERVYEAGFLKKYHVKKGFHFHMNAKSPLNYLNYGKGRVFGASSSFRITLKGKSAHGSRSYEGRDPMNAAIQLSNIMYSIVQKEVDVFRHTIFYILPFTASTCNMIPDEIVMNCRLLCYDDDVTPYLMERFQEAAEGVGHALRIQTKFEKISFVPGFSANPEFTDLLLKAAAKVLPADRISKVPEVKRGAEDFAFLVNHMDACTSFFLGAGPTETEPYEYGQHSTKVVFNEKTIPVGVALETTMVYDYLNGEEE